MDPRNDQGRDGCDLWLWDGTLEYEGALVKENGGAFTAYLREKRRERASAAPGRRVNTTTFDLQRQFAGRRFLAYSKSGGADLLIEAVVSSVQRSTSLDFDFFVSGRFLELQERHREALKSMALRDVGALIAEETEKQD